MLNEGDILLGRFKIERLIGAGGMGLIFRALDEQTYEHVALKVLRPTPELSSEDVRRFEREARLLVQLDHPHVLDVYEVAELESGIPVLVMELLKGRDLRQEIRVRERFPVEEAIGYVLQATAALGAVHDAGIMHRDIKPQNLFITQLTGARHIKLLDFGISKMDSDGEATLTATQSTLGTPQYMSPEQILGTREVDHLTDIWSMGVVLYFLLAGRVPFNGPSPSAIIAAIPNTIAKPLGTFRNDISAQVINIVERCLSKDPEGRPASADELHQLLLPFGPPEGIIIAPAIDVPDTVPPVLLGTQAGGQPMGARANPLIARDRAWQGKQSERFTATEPATLALVHAVKAAPLLAPLAPDGGLKEACLENIHLSDREETSRARPSTTSQEPLLKARYQSLLWAGVTFALFASSAVYYFYIDTPKAKKAEPNLLTKEATIRAADPPPVLVLPPLPEQAPQDALPRIPLKQLEQKKPKPRNRPDSKKAPQKNKEIAPPLFL